MERILIYIKHNFKLIWLLFEWGNGLLFDLLYRKKLNNQLRSIFTEFTLLPYSYRALSQSDAQDLYSLIQRQELSDLEFFRPHGHDLHSINNQFSNRTLLMMGVFDRDNLVGYFFLRFFANKKCFVGRLIDRDYRGKGIGINMNHIMYEISWRIGFRCLSTISNKNKNVLKAHAKNPTISIVKKLPNDYLLVEFIKDNTES